MVYYEIYRKKKSDPLSVDFKYYKTAMGIGERDAVKKRLIKLGYRVRTRKTRYATPPTITKIRNR